jgi:hypothetical protein
LNVLIRRWVEEKFRLRSKKAVLVKYQAIVQSNSGLFIHWQKGIKYWLNNKSRVKGDFHARICERLKLKCFGLLDPIAIAMPSQMLNRCTSPETTSYIYLSIHDFADPTPRNF